MRAAATLVSVLHMATYGLTSFRHPQKLGSCFIRGHLKSQSSAANTSLAAILSEQVFNNEKKKYTKMWLE